MDPSTLQFHDEKMVSFYQNCSDLLLEKKSFTDQKKLLKFEAEGREFAKFLRSLEQLKFRQSKINSRWVAGPTGQTNRRPSV